MADSESKQGPFDLVICVYAHETKRLIDPAIKNVDIDNVDLDKFAHDELELLMHLLMEALVLFEENGIPSKGLRAWTIATVNAVKNMPSWGEPASGVSCVKCSKSDPRRCLSMDREDFFCSWDCLYQFYVGADGKDFPISTKADLLKQPKAA